MPEHRVRRGFNDVKPKWEVTVITTISSDHGAKPRLVAGTYRKGRAVTGRSDTGPHWLPAAFIARDGYGRLGRQTLSWLAAAEVVQ